MLRVLASVLAAFVGFSFGNAIPKWMESRRGARSAAAASKAKEAAAASTSSSLSSSSHGHGEASSSSSSCSSSSSSRRKSLRIKAHTKFKFGSTSKPFKVENSLRAFGFPDSANPGANARSEKGEKENVGIPECKYDEETARRNQMKEWKDKLLSLKNKAMENERAWYQKFGSKQQQQQAGEEAAGCASRKVSFSAMKSFDLRKTKKGSQETGCDIVMFAPLEAMEAKSEHKKVAFFKGKGNPHVVPFLDTHCGLLDTRCHADVER